MRAQHLGLFHLQVLRLDHEDQVARRDGAAVDRGAHVVGQGRAGGDSLHEPRKALRRFTQGPQRQGRHHDDAGGQRPETQGEPGLDRHPGKVHSVLR